MQNRSWRTIEKWEKSFQLLYTKIKKSQKRISYQMPLLGVSATLTQSKHLHIIEKVGFSKNFQLYKPFQIDQCLI